MKFVIKQINEAGETSFYNGSIFVSEVSDAKVIESLQDARYLQGVFQSQFISSEVSKVAAAVSVSLG